jgi:rod shape determining protein RodA
MRRVTKEPFETGGLDWPALFIYLAMICLGWLAIYSAVYDAKNPVFFNPDSSSGRQLIFIGISLLLGIVLLIIDAKFYSAFAYFFYGLAILLCIAVIFIGSETKGAKAWFTIGSFKFQPVELAKFATALALGKYLGHYDISFKDLKTKLISFLLFLVPMALVLLQNDTGSALVFLAFFLVLYREGLPTILIVSGIFLAVLFILALLVSKLYIVIALGTIAAISAYAFRKSRQALLVVLVSLALSVGFVYTVDYLFYNVLQEHQRARITVLFGTGGDDWNVRQSMIAIGSGGFLGQGYLNGTQTKGNFVPEQSTDFIYCTIGEEIGFLGAGFVVLLFVFLMIRLVYIAERQKNKFSRIYAYSVACIFFVHFTINIGMTIGLMPVIGIPLPFFSYGGSSLLGFTLLLFTLLKLDANRVNEMMSIKD